MLTIEGLTLTSKDVLLNLLTRQGFEIIEAAECYMYYVGSKSLYIVFPFFNILMLLDVQWLTIQNIEIGEMGSNSS